MQRVDEPPDLPLEEVRFEAAAVLAGTILMSTGVCGTGPGSHSSDTTLSTRSEEHTSELQSRRNLVCRLLLEKKKQQSTS